ncbi:hypothetical protein COU60_02445 [Candidatus Pacearchaeota archaeon CG10_big_fil_rev_8_21_14_0_10_34_76]|nr:MAG: hypothetical protein COU60_02445 [Candidatus Pacearchaeota archaeon CG10_big_fil_rev_8_21_14_0_10_34_76]
MAKPKCEICDREFKNQEALEFHNQAKHPSSSPQKSTKSIKGSKKAIAWAVGLIIIVGIIALIIFSSSGAEGKYDTFSQCIANSGAVMYGAYWCPHCQDQKEMFGKSWEHVNDIECSLPNRAGQTAECNEAGIQSYPTWEFADGSRQTGVLSFQQLSQLTGCPVVQDE